MTDETDDEIMEIEEAFEHLADMRGQQYILTNRAFELALPFWAHLDVAFVTEHDDMADAEAGDEIGEEDAQYAISQALRKIQRPAEEARGIASVWPHQQIMTVADVTAMLVRGLNATDGEPSDAQALGAGSTKDIQHEENVEKIAAAIGALPVPTDE